MTPTEIPDSNYDPETTVSSSFNLEYGGVDRKIRFVNFELPESQTDKESLQKKAYSDWDKYSSQFEKDAQAKVENLGMLILTMKDSEKIYIMIEQGESVKDHRIYFDYRGITGRGRVVEVENQEEEKDIYSEEMTKSFINVAKKSIDYANLSQSFKSGLS